MLITTPKIMVSDSGRSTEAGFSMLFLIGVILALSTLAAGIASMSTSSVYNQLNALSFAQARAVALSGYTYVQQFKEDYDELEGQTIQLSDDSEFTVGDDMRQRQDSEGNLWMDVEIIGTVHKDTAFEANYVLDRSFQPEDQGAITFADNWEDFKETTPDDNTTPITKNEDKTFTIGNNAYYAFGAFYYTGSKTLNWGDNKCVYGECQFNLGFRLFFVSHYEKSDADGIVFTWFNARIDDTKYYDTDAADYDNEKYTQPESNNSGTANNLIYVSRMYACDNSLSSCEPYMSVGGDSQHGEMIGYAGDGRYYSSYGSYSATVKGWLDPEQNGIQAPKMGIEFDNYHNGSTSICSNGTTAPPQTSSRNDPSVPHIAYVFWGESQTDTVANYPCAVYNGESQTCTEYVYEKVKGKWQWVCKNYETTYTYYTVTGTPSGGLTAGVSNIPGGNTYDDNRHGLGSNTKSYVDSSWTNKAFAFRAEVERSRSATGSGYAYTITSWKRNCSDTTCRKYWDDSYYTENSLTDIDDLYFSDTSRFLCHDTSDTNCTSAYLNTPLLEQTVYLDADENEQFETMMFGFTEATGGSTQKSTYSQFILQFIKENDYYWTDTGKTVIDNRRRVHKRKID